MTPVMVLDYVDYPVKSRTGGQKINVLLPKSPHCCRRSEHGKRKTSSLHIFTPNGASNYPVPYTPDTWLLWDWDGDGEADNPPSATLTYGVYEETTISFAKQINNSKEGYPAWS